MIPYISTNGDDYLQFLPRYASVHVSSSTGATSPCSFPRRNGGWCPCLTYRVLLTNTFLGTVLFMCYILINIYSLRKLTRTLRHHSTAWIWLKTTLLSETSPGWESKTHLALLININNPPSQESDPGDDGGGGDCPRLLLTATLLAAAEVVVTSVPDP
ncbi:unnamed protein product [Linum trigynum]|uniref:Uncharacterized protein n=1 Tax=Linum trigynum TaxID=586398 RepID=A0AAV2G6C9_9ROSI